jgi:hypothetical protein
LGRSNEQRILKYNDFSNASVARGNAGMLPHTILKYVGSFGASLLLEHGDPGFGYVDRVSAGAR